MTLWVMATFAVLLGVAVQRAHRWDRRWRAALAIAVAAAVAFLAYVVETSRAELATERSWGRLHCEFFADGRLRSVADDAVGLPIERFEPSKALSSNRLNDYFREISFCKHDGRGGHENRCAESLRQELYAAAKETSPTAFADRLRKVAASIKAGPRCD